MDQPLVSVIIPAYNAKRTIRQALTSAQRQTYPYLEIIVVDDGSTDGTMSMIPEENNILPIIHSHNRGLSAARNTGVEKARGQYIAFLDADDQWHPQKIAIQVKEALKIEDLGLLGTKFVRTQENETFLDFPEIQQDNLPLEPYDIYAFMEHWSFLPSTVLMPRSLYLEVGGCADEWVCTEDRDLWLKTVYKKKAYRVPLPLTYWTQAPHSLSNTKLLIGAANVPLMLEQWDPRRKNSLDKNRQIDPIRFEESLRSTVGYYGKRILRYGCIDHFNHYWLRFGYIFGNKKNLVRQRLIAEAMVRDPRFLWRRIELAQEFLNRLSG